MNDLVEPVWIEAELALAIHDRQLAEHGGPIGLRDASALESALDDGPDGREVRVTVKRAGQEQVHVMRVKEMLR